MLASMTETDPLNWSEERVNDLLPTGTVTLLLADVEGSTRLWETRPNEMTAAVENLDRTLADLVGAHRGATVQGEGDSFVVAFTRASDAVACALALQRAPLSPILLRIGVHTGEVQLRDEGNYIGSTINRTGRLRDLAHGGQSVLSGTTSDLVMDRLPPDAWWPISAAILCATCLGPNTSCSCAVPTCTTSFRHCGNRKVMCHSIFRLS